MNNPVEQAPQPYGYIVELRSVHSGKDLMVARSRVQPSLAVAKACVDGWKLIYKADYWRFVVISLFAAPTEAPPVEQSHAELVKGLEKRADHLGTLLTDPPKPHPDGELMRRAAATIRAALASEPSA